MPTATGSTEVTSSSCGRCNGGTGCCRVDLGGVTFGGPVSGPGPSGMLLQLRLLLELIGELLGLLRQLRDSGNHSTGNAQAQSADRFENHCERAWAPSSPAQCSAGSPSRGSGLTGSGLIRAGGGGATG